jgi:hypothetical protein
MACRHLLQNTPLRKWLDVGQSWKKKKIGILDLTSVVASAHPVSFILKHIWMGVKIQVYGHFQEMLLAMNILKGRLFM